MINPKCDLCGVELNDYGALLFSPPVGRKTNKYHVCVKCFQQMIPLKIYADYLRELRLNQPRVTLKEAQEQAKRVMYSAKTGLLKRQ